MVVVKTEVREQIVVAASAIFSRFGFKKTTMDEIALAMRKGKSSIYYYFTSKEEIFEAVVLREELLLRDELNNAVNCQKLPQDKLRFYILTRMRELQKLTNLYEALKSDYLGHLDFIERIRKSHDEAEVSMIENLLKNGVNEGLFRVENSTLASIAISTAMKGLEIHLFGASQQNDLEKQLDNVLNVLFYGIVKQ
jgi:AcrR family transcriptional regulator